MNVPGGSNRNNYANVELIVKVARRCEADAVWPVRLPPGSPLRCWVSCLCIAAHRSSISDSLLRPRLTSNARNPGLGSRLGEPEAPSHARPPRDRLHWPLGRRDGRSRRQGAPPSPRCPSASPDKHAPPPPVFPSSPLFLPSRPRIASDLRQPPRPVRGRERHPLVRDGPYRARDHHPAGRALQGEEGGPRPSITPRSLDRRRRKAQRSAQRSAAAVCAAEAAAGGCWGLAARFAHHRRSPCCPVLPAKSQHSFLTPYPRSPCVPTPPTPPNPPRRPSTASRRRWSA